MEDKYAIIDLWLRLTSALAKGWRQEYVLTHSSSACLPVNNLLIVRATEASGLRNALVNVD